MEELIKQKIKTLTEEHAQLMNKLTESQQLTNQLTQRILEIKGAVLEMQKLLEELKKESVSDNDKSTKTEV